MTIEELAKKLGMIINGRIGYCDWTGSWIGEGSIYDKVDEYRVHSDEVIGWCFDKHGNYNCFEFFFTRQR
jgi:hypothetical protein